MIKNVFRAGVAGHFTEPPSGVLDIFAPQFGTNSFCTEKAPLSETFFFSYINLEDIFQSCGSHYTSTTHFICSDAVLSSPWSLPLLRGPAFCSLVLFLSHYRLNCSLPTAHPLLLPLPSISYSIFLCWTKAQCFQA